MATYEGTQEALGVVGLNVEIIRQVVDASKTNSYVDGGAAFPGKALWITTNTADNDATQAAAILTGLA